MEFNLEALTSLKEREFFFSWKYLAGLIDSDGNIYFDYRKTKNGMYPIIKISIASKYPNILFSICGLLGKGNIYQQKNCWILNFIGNDSIDVLSDVVDFLIIKKRQAIFCLENVFTKVNNVDDELIKTMRLKNSNFRHEIDEKWEFDYEWFAGFFDGDGYIGSYKNKKCSTLKISMAVTIDKKDFNFYNKLPEFIGGFIRKVRNNVQWYSNINIDKNFILENLCKYSNLKYYQCKICLEYILTGKPSYDYDVLNETLSELKQCEVVYPFHLNDVDLYQRWTRTTAIYPKEKSLEYTALGLSGEVGELCNKIKKIIRDKNNVISETDLQCLKSELADCLWYAARFLDDLDIRLSDALGSNVIKLNSRKSRNKLSGSGDNR